MSTTETEASEVAGREGEPPIQATTAKDDSSDPGIGEESANDSSADDVHKKEEKTGNDGVGTPHEQDMVPLSLEDQLRKLTAKLHEIEKQTEQARLKQEDLEKQVQDPQGDFRLPLPIPVESNDRLRSHSRRRDYGNREYNWLSRHRQDMIKMYQRELAYLEREETMIEGLFEEREGWKGEAYETMRQSTRRPRGASSGSYLTSDPGTVEPLEPQEAPGPEIIQPPPFAISELKYFRWSIFKSFRVAWREESDYYAIDVLQGEPELSWQISRPGFAPSRASFQYRGNEFSKPLDRVPERKSVATLASKKQQPILPGQAQLPERIRIHSRHILKVLTKISGTSLSNDEWDPVVMIRPFKTLVYYHDQVRQRIQELEAIFGVPDYSERSLTEDGHEMVVPEEKKENAGSQPETGEDESDDESTGIVEIVEKEVEDEDISSVIALHHLRLLDEFMNKEVQCKMDYLGSNSYKVVSFNDLWYLFSPGDVVIDEHRRQAYRVMSVTSTTHKVIPPYKTSWDRESAREEETPIILKCVYIDFDGKQLGPVSKFVEIPRYDGEKLVTLLEVYPLRFAEHPISEDKESLRDLLIARGKKFLEITSVKHMHYSGYALETKEEIDSQVVIDFEEAFSSQQMTGSDNRSRQDVENWTPHLEILIETDDLKGRPERSCTYACCRDENVHQDAVVEKIRNTEYISSLVPEDRNKHPSVAIYPRKLDTKKPEAGVTEDELVIMSYRVFGFVLRSRKWAKLDLTYLHPIGHHIKETSECLNGGVIDGKGAAEVQGVEEIEKNEQKQKTAFDQLVLPPGHKPMVVSLIAQHFRDKESATADDDQNDIVRGKGKGLIILLHGLPGVGKTTTAEGIAELFKKPLFQITCGDLGTTAAEVEAALEKHFALASRWGCILLLDEADVFLAARTPQDFIRNGLVSVFLRVLEYYTGVLFLTTNRIGDFDEAFASRIHISLHYPELNLDSTIKIFELNLRLIRERRKVNIDEASILAFAERYWRTNKKMRWNGRQIRNACQTALALAEFDAQGKSHETVKYANAEVKFTVAHLEIVSKAYLDFIMYLKKIYGQTGERRAKAMGLRAREGATKNDDEDEEDDFEELIRPNAAAAVTHPAPLAKAAPHPEQAAPAHPGYPPYGGPPPNWQGGYQAGPSGYGYPPPHGYAPPPPGWQPQQGAGQYGNAPMDGTGGHQ